MMTLKHPACQKSSSSNLQSDKVYI